MSTSFNADYAAFDFKNSVVGYDPFQGNSYLRNGILVLGQERIEMGVDGENIGPWHSLGHFFEAPDKWCNKPYFGFRMKNCSTYREGIATTIQMALMKKFGCDFSKKDWDCQLKCLVFQFELDHSFSKLEINTLINETLEKWTVSYALEEWKRKNDLIQSSLIVDPTFSKYYPVLPPPSWEG